MTGRRALKGIRSVPATYNLLKQGAGVTLDTGALIAIERDKRRVLLLLDAAIAAGLPIRVPAAVVGEFWRGQHSRDMHELVAATCVPDTLLRAKQAGEALAATGARTRTRGPSVVDAIVATVAAERGDRVLTSDPGDLTELAAWFGGLTILGV